MAGSITDISENKRAAAALQHERDRLRQILDTYFGFVAVFTPAGAITEVNQTPLTLMGLTRADVLGRLFWDVGWLETGETVPQVQAMIAAAARGEMSRGDILARFPGVGVRDVEVVFSPLRDAAGQVVSVISFGVDITERKQAELRQARHVDRLKQLSELSLMLSGDPGVVFERVVRLIGELFAVKVVCLSEIAGKELLFRAVYVEGQVFANAGGCPLEITPCATVEQHKEIQVYDRVAELFPQAAFLREHRAHAYCGFPALDNAGRVVAVTCLLDDQPHEFTEEDQHLLRIIGQRLATEVERGKIVAERTKTDQALHASETRLNEAQRIARVGGWELDLVTGRLHWSDEIFRLFELDPAQFGATYEAFLHAVHPDDRDAVNAAYTGSLRDRKPYRIVHRLRMADGRIKHVEEQCETDFAPDGTPLESRGTVQDVTGRVLAERALQASLREKTTLLQEIHHRVKNNLQVVSSLLFFEQRRAAHPAVAAQFQRSHDRVAAISLVHERLYQAPDLVGINFAPYVETLGQHVLRGFSGQAGPVALRVEGAGFKLGVTEAVPCALIVNELLANSLKHAFPAGRAGTVTIRLEADAAGARHLWFGDDGAGLPGDVLPAGGRSLGLRLVEQLTEQLQATFVREPAVQGLRFHLTIPAVNPP
jgi:PAS domain S-box-containing protein